MFTKETVIDRPFTQIKFICHVNTATTFVAKAYQIFSKEKYNKVSLSGRQKLFVTFFFDK